MTVEQKISLIEIKDKDDVSFLKKQDEEYKDIFFILISLAIDNPSLFKKLCKDMSDSNMSHESKVEILAKLSSMENIECRDEIEEILLPFMLAYGIMPCYL